MSEDQKVSSGQPGEVSDQNQGDTQAVTSGNDSVKYDTYKKVLGEKKAADQKLRELEMRLEQMEIEKATAEGNKDELLVKFQEQNRQLQDRLKQKDQAYAFANLSSQVKTEAAKMGCQDPDSLVKLMDLANIPVDPESYRADTDNIRMMLEDEKKSRPFFFGKQAPAIQDVSQSNTIHQKPVKDLSNLDRKELDELVRKMGSEKI